MSALDTLWAARAAGVKVTLDGNEIALRATLPPDPELLAQLKRYKQDIVELLRAERGWIPPPAEESIPIPPVSSEPPASSPPPATTQRPSSNAYVTAASLEPIRLSDHLTYDFVKLRERLLAFLRGTSELRRYGFGTIDAKMLDADTEISCARHSNGERRIYVIRRDPVKLLLRLVWGPGESKQPLTMTSFQPGDWLDRIIENGRIDMQSSSPAWRGGRPGSDTRLTRGESLFRTNPGGAE